MSSRTPCAAAAAVLVLLGSSPAAAQTHTSLKRVVAAPVQRTAVLSPTTVTAKLVLPAGQVAGVASGGTTQLGPVATYQLQFAASTTGAGLASYSKTQPTGTIQFAPGDQQAMAVSQCFARGCLATSLQLIIPTPPTRTVFTFQSVKFTQVSVGQSINASFVAAKAAWQMPGAKGKAGATDDAVSSPATTAPGINVEVDKQSAATGRVNKTIPLGVASDLHLQPAPASPGAGASRKAGPATGSLSFAAGDEQPLRAASCLFAACTNQSLRIRNVTPTGTTVYTLVNVRFTQLQIGGTTTASFTYDGMQYQTFAPNSLQPATHGGWDFINLRPM